jgi:DNA-binding phage protein
MINGQDAAELPRRKRGRPPGSRKTTSMSKQRRMQRQEGSPGATYAVGEQKQSPDGTESPLLATNEVNEEQLMYELAEENLTSFSNFLRSILRRDRAEITRVAREMDVAENTIYRWMSGSSDPRANHLKRLPDVLPEYRGNLSYVINQTFPGVLDMQTAGIREVRKDVYRRVLDLVALTGEEDTRFWQVSQAIFEYALLHLDVERQGMAITFARLMPPHKDGVHSLRESAMRGNAPWPFDIESKAYLGSTTLAGAAVAMQRMLVWNSVGGGDRLQVEVDDYEASACAAPVMRGGRIAGALIVSSTQSMFFNDPMACQAVVEYAQLLATALAERDFQLHTLLNLRPMPELRVQRTDITRSYVNRILIYARKYDISRWEAEMRVRGEMELEFEELARTQVEQRQSQDKQRSEPEKRYGVSSSG